MNKKSYLVLVAIVAASLVNCSGLPSMKSSIVVSSKVVGGKKIQTTLPYTIEVNYWGYVKPGTPPDGLIDGSKKAYYLYLWIPAVIAEISIRMISPTGEIGEPGKNDMVSETFKKATSAEKNMPNWFDTWIRIERMNAFMPDKIVAGKNTVVQKLKDNDDGDRTYDEKRHSRYNSYATISISPLPKSVDDLAKIDTKKLLVRGLYRISFTTFKRGDVKGSFVASVGVLFPPGISGVTPLIDNDPARLQERAIEGEKILKQKLGDLYKKMTGQ